MLLQNMEGMSLCISWYGHAALLIKGFCGLYLGLLPSLSTLCPKHHNHSHNQQDIISLGTTSTGTPQWRGGGAFAILCMLLLSYFVYQAQSGLFWPSSEQQAHGLEGTQEQHATTSTASGDYDDTPVSDSALPSASGYPQGLNDDLYDSLDSSAEASTGTSKLEGRTFHIPSGRPQGSSVGRWRYPWPVSDPACSSDQRKWIRFCYENEKSRDNVQAAFTMAISRWRVFNRPAVTSLNIGPARACYTNGNTDWDCLCDEPYKAGENDVLVIKDGDGEGYTFYSTSGYEPSPPDRSIKDNPINYIVMGHADPASKSPPSKLPEAVAHELGKL
jgi:hypothetical protein